MTSSRTGSCKKIVWRKWSDPLAPLVKTYTPEEDDDDPGFHDARQSFGLKVQDKPEKPPKRGQLGPAVLGPHGIIPLRESNLPSTLFNFWMGDTNFDVTHHVKNDIASVPGVETIDVFTRYRFRIGVGRAFRSDEVLREIERTLIPPPSRPQPSILEHALAKKFPHWAILFVEDGKVEVFGGNTPEEVMEKTGGAIPTAQKAVFSWRE